MLLQSSLLLERVECVLQLNQIELAAAVLVELAKECVHCIHMHTKAEALDVHAELRVGIILNEFVW